MNKILNALSRKGILPVMAILLLAIQSASGDTYLTTVGPPPLRFQFVDTSNSLFMAELALPKPTPVAQPPMPAPQPEAKAETHIAGGVPVFGPLGTVAGIPILTGAGKNAFIPGGSASDMLSITPQMISEYFKPYRAEGAPEPTEDQRGQTFSVPAELGFVPPMPGSRTTSK